MAKKIKYNQIEGIIQDNIIVFNGEWRQIKEDIKRMPKEVTLLD